METGSREILVHEVSLHGSNAAAIISDTFHSIENVRKSGSFNGITSKTCL